MLSRLSGAAVSFAAAEAGPIITDTRQLVLNADAVLAEVEGADVLVVPGGPGQFALMTAPDFLGELRRIDDTTAWTTSVCTGSLLLGAAGLLEGKRATTHWLVHDHLAALGATPVTERVVVDGKIVAAAGVSAGIDMALWLAAELGGRDVAEAIQLAIEYDPHPPFTCGSPRSAPPPVVAAATELLSDPRLFSN